MSAKRFGQRIDLQVNEILNMIFQKSNGLPTPTTALAGAPRFNTADGRFYVCDGSAWNLKATNADALAGFSPAQLRDRGTHSGTQDVSTISGFDAGVNARRITDFTSLPNKALPMGGQQITGLAAGAASGDAVNFGQLQAVRDMAVSAAAGVAIKEPVIAAAPANITITAPPVSIDGITIPQNGRILLPNQTDATQNGIYIRPATGALIRATDADAAGEILPGTQVFVTRGQTYEDTAWVLVSNDPITPGTSPQGWSRVPGSAGQQMTFDLGLEVINGTTVRVKPGLGISVADGSVSIDTTVVVRKYVQAIAAGTSPVVVNHGLGTQDLSGIKLRDLATGDYVDVGETSTGVNTVSLDFAVNPLANQYRVVISG